MAIDPRQMILQMMMQQGGGQGAPPMGIPPGLMTPGVRPRAAPDVGTFTDSGVEETASEVQDMMTPSDEDPEAPSAFPPARDVAPGMQGGLPPEIMELAAQGIGPQQFASLSQGVGERAMTRSPDRASDEEDVDPMESYGKPGDEKDPRFGPKEDRLRDDTERELDDVRQNMGKREINDIAEEIRNAINDNDQAAYGELMKELEETGIDPDELPPDIQKMMEENDADDDERGSTEDPQDA